MQLGLEWSTLGLVAIRALLGFFLNERRINLAQKEVEHLDPTVVSCGTNDIALNRISSSLGESDVADFIDITPDCADFLDDFNVAGASSLDDERGHSVVAIVLRWITHIGHRSRWLRDISSLLYEGVNCFRTFEGNSSLQIESKFVRIESVTLTCKS